MRALGTGRAGGRAHRDAGLAGERCWSAARRWARRGAAESEGRAGGRRMLARAPGAQGAGARGSRLTGE